MALATLLEMDWFKDQVDEEDVDAFESNFRSSKRTLEALDLWITHEQAKIDNSTTLQSLRELPDRAEVTLMAAAQKDVLSRLRKLIQEEE